MLDCASYILFSTRVYTWVLTHVDFFSFLRRRAAYVWPPSSSLILTRNTTPHVSRPGTARQGTARYGTAPQGKTLHGTVTRPGHSSRTARVIT